MSKLKQLRQEEYNILIDYIIDKMNMKKVVFVAQKNNTNRLYIYKSEYNKKYNSTTDAYYYEDLKNISNNETTNLKEKINSLHKFIKEEILKGGKSWK